MHIPSFVIQDLKSRVRLSDILDREMGLNKLKKNPSDSGSFTACCPFHNDKSPSLSINDDTGIYHCFGCNETGDVFDLYTNHIGKTFREAVSTLASEAGVDLETILKDVDKISSAPSAPNNRHILRLTNLIFNEYSRYDLYKQGYSRFTDKITLPTSLNEMKYTMAATNYLFDSKDGGAIAIAVNEDVELKKAAQYLGLIDDTSGAFKYVRDHCFLPTFTLNHEVDGGSQLPYIVTGQNRPLQFHCSGFVVLDSNMEHVGHYPVASSANYSGLLLPPPHIADIINPINKLYVTDTPEQFIDLVCCGVSNVVSPAYGSLNHQHLRQLSHLPVQELHWVTTKETLAHPQVISRLSLFNECIGTGKTISFTFLKNNEDNTAFSSLVVDHKEVALENIESRKVTLGNVMKIALPSIQELQATQKNYALNAINTYIRRCIRNGTDAERRDATNLAIELIQSGLYSTEECIAKISNLPKKDLLFALDSSEQTPSSLEALVSLNSNQANLNILKSKFLEMRTGVATLFGDLEISDENTLIAEHLARLMIESKPDLFDILTPANNRSPE